MRRLVLTLLACGMLASSAMADGYPYGALAVGFNPVSNMVVSGTGEGNTESEAEDAAKSFCEFGGTVPRCEVVGTFSDGACGYISIGRSADDLTYATGSTEEEAIESCSSDGFDCPAEFVMGLCTREFN